MSLRTAPPVRACRLSAAARLAALAFIAPGLIPSAGAAGAPAPMCWRPADLWQKPFETIIRRGLAAAYRPLPTGQPIAPNAAQQALVARFRGQVVRRVELPAGVKRIALTFDLCEQPHEIAGYQGASIDFLRRAGVRATFFAGGKWLLTHAERARQLMADPLFEVGNHGWEHRNMKLLSGTKLRDEIVAPQLAYQIVRTPLVASQCRARDGAASAADRAPARMNLLRFPFGACSRQALGAVANAGLIAIQWDFASGDPAPSQTANRLYHTVMRRVRPGSIIVFHANGRGWHTPAALPRLVAELRRRGYQFVTVSELLTTPGARIVTAPACFDQRPGDLDRYDRRAIAMHAFFDRFEARQAARGRPRHTATIRRPSGRRKTGR